MRGIPLIRELLLAGLNAIDGCSNVQKHYSVFCCQILYYMADTCNQIMSSNVVIPVDEQNVAPFECYLSSCPLSMHNGPKALMMGLEWDFSI